MTKREKKLVKKVSKHVERTYSVQCNHCGNMSTFYHFNSIMEAAVHVYNHGWQVHGEWKNTNLVCPKCLKGSKNG